PPFRWWLECCDELPTEPSPGRRDQTPSGRFSSPLIIFVVLLQTLSSLSASFLNCGDQNWPQYS
ncbi:unnamed protein product, partial [Bubo scandiacus]